MVAASVSLVDVEGVESSQGWEVSSTTGSKDRPPARRWWRRIAVATAILGAIVVAVVMSGRSDGDAEPVADSTVPTTAVAESSTTRAAVDGVDGTATGTGTGTTTTEVPRLLDGTGSPLPIPVLGEPTGLSLVGHSIGELAIVDLDSGSVTIRSDRVDVGGAGAASVQALAAVADRLLLRVGTSNSGSRIVAVGPAGVVELADDEDGREPWVLVVRMDLPVIWELPVPGDLGSTAAARLVDLDTGTVEATIDVPQSVYPVSATEGGIVVLGVGGVYELPIDGPARRLSTGWASPPPFDEVFASAPGPLIVEECDDTLTCTTLLLDPTTGLSRPTSMASSGFFRQSASASPDGRHALVYDWSTGTLSLVDTEDGTEVELFSSEFDGVPSATWSPDGRWLVYVEGGLPIVVDTRDDSSRAVQVEGRRPRSEEWVVLPTATVSLLLDIGAES